MLAALSQISEDERYKSQLRDRYYKVRRGNTLAGIAKHFEVDIDDLVAVNDLRSRHRIRAGQVLTLPLPGGVKVDPAARVPATSAPATRAAATLVAENGRYTVRRGDSVWLIARRLAIDEEILVSLNDLGDGKTIQVGQVLQVEPEKPQPIVVAAVNVDTAPATQSAVAPASEPALANEVPQAASETSPEVVAAVAVAEDEVLQARELQVRELLARELLIQEAVEVAAEVLADTTPEHVSDGLIARVEQAEPVSAEEAEEISPSLPLTVQPELSADPSDYSVANDSIEVQATETLGHYADWLELRTWRLRHLNGMRYGQPVVIGQRLSLDFSRVTASDFEHRRVAYQRALQESFFKHNRIAGTSTHVIRRGESLWILARRQYRIPVWLLRQYNPDMTFDAVDIGAKVTVPQVEPLDEEPPIATTTAKAG
jgi:membrane-bound lytic murein transglycosylase D